MIDLDKILKEWQKDALIDILGLDDASRKTPVLHGKYLEYLAQAKLEMKDSEFKQKELMKWKYLYYEGKMSKDEIDRFGWDYDPYEGRSATTNKFKEQFIETDEDLVNSEKKIQYLTTCIDTLKEILETLKWRHQTIGNIIRWKQFEAGF